EECVVVVSTGTWYGACRPLREKGGGRQREMGRKKRRLRKTEKSGKQEKRDEGATHTGILTDIVTAGQPRTRRRTGRKMARPEVK
ncbi:hypothetical protein KUCAC02_008328, partial [Chaenocephalus aceratus]